MILQKTTLAQVTFAAENPHALRKSRREARECAGSGWRGRAEESVRPTRPGVCRVARG